MIISEELAQRIVDSAMLLVHRNVNIMNRDGVIIATGHPHRRHTFHKGAKDVIETGMVIEIYPDQLELYPGALQGVNLPIVFDEQVVGVIGVFGVPDEVRDTGRLVKAITELILERELLQEETRSRYKLREQFLETALSADASAALPKLKRLAKAMNLTLSLPRTVSITDVAPFIQTTVSSYGSSELVLERSIEAILKHIEQSKLVREQDIAVIWDEKLIVLKGFPKADQPEPIADWGRSLLDSLHELSPEITCCGIGGMVDSVCDYEASYQQARYCLSACRTDRPPRIISDRQLLVGYTLVESMGLPVIAALTPLTQKFCQFIDKKIEGQKTLEALLESNLNLSTAANALHIHRNTLMFRLDQFHSMTGLDPVHNFEDAVLCRVLLEQNGQKHKNCVGIPLRTDQFDSRSK
jgi:carbohydrate diacid regulator